MRFDNHCRDPEGGFRGEGVDESLAATLQESVDKEVARRKMSAMVETPTSLEVKTEFIFISFSKIKLGTY